MAALLDEALNLTSGTMPVNAGKHLAAVRALKNGIEERVGKIENPGRAAQLREAVLNKEATRKLLESAFLIIKDCVTNICGKATKAAAEKAAEAFKKTGSYKALIEGYKGTALAERVELPPDNVETARRAYLARVKAHVEKQEGIGDENYEAAKKEINALRSELKGLEGKGDQYIYNRRDGLASNDVQRYQELRDRTIPELEKRQERRNFKRTAADYVLQRFTQRVADILQGQDPKLVTQIYETFPEGFSDGRYSNWGKQYVNDADLSFVPDDLRTKLEAEIMRAYALVASLDTKPYSDNDRGFQPAKEYWAYLSAHKNKKLKPYTAPGYRGFTAEGQYKNIVQSSSSLNGLFLNGNYTKEFGDKGLGQILVQYDEEFFPDLMALRQITLAKSGKEDGNGQSYSNTCIQELANIPGLTKTATGIPYRPEHRDEDVSRTAEAFARGQAIIDANQEQPTKKEDSELVPVVRREFTSVAAAVEQAEAIRLAALKEIARLQNEGQDSGTVTFLKEAVARFETDLEAAPEAVKAKSPFYAALAKFIAEVKGKFEGKKE